MGSALEWALALLHAPGERQGLRQRPLPADGMDLLLGIAAGTQPAQLAEQARRFDVSEADILEAARFYAREVLLHPQADAYRVLGVMPDAGDAQIKAHYRLLQHWLHPDRVRNDEDALFAARVNAAWNQLRSPQRRRAYDAALRQAALPAPPAGPAVPRGGRPWVPEPMAAVAPSPWLQRLPLLALCGLCLVLALLALRDDGPPPEAAWPALPAAPQAEPGPEPAAVAMVLRGRPLPQPVSAPTGGGTGREGARSAARPGRPAPAVDSPSPGLTAAPTPLPTADLAARTPGPHRQQDRREAVPLSVPAAADGGVAAFATAAAPVVAGAVPVETGGSGALLARQPSGGGDEEAPAFDHIQAARRAGAQLLHYLDTPDSVAPPIWNSPAVETQADRLRRDLHAQGRARLGSPQWRIGHEQAVFTADVLPATPAPVRSRLAATLRWRDGRWLVAALSEEVTP